NRGVVYLVPTQHLRQRLPDATAISIAERAYQFLAGSSGRSRNKILELGRAVCFLHRLSRSFHSGLPTALPRRACNSPQLSCWLGLTVSNLGVTLTTFMKGGNNGRRRRRSECDTRGNSGGG